MHITPVIVNNEFEVARDAFLEMASRASVFARSKN